MAQGQGEASPNLDTKHTALCDGDWDVDGAPLLPPLPPSVVSESAPDNSSFNTRLRPSPLLAQSPCWEPAAEAESSSSRQAKHRGHSMLLAANGDQQGGQERPYLQTSAAATASAGTVPTVLSHHQPALATTELRETTLLLRPSTPVGTSLPPLPAGCRSLTAAYA